MKKDTIPDNRKSSRGSKVIEEVLEEVKEDEEVSVSSYKMVILPLVKADLAFVPLGDTEGVGRHQAIFFDDVLRLVVPSFTELIRGCDTVAFDLKALIKRLLRDHLLVQLSCACRLEHHEEENDHQNEEQTDDAQAKLDESPHIKLQFVGKSDAPRYARGMRICETSQASHRLHESGLLYLPIQAYE